MVKVAPIPPERADLAGAITGLEAADLRLATLAAEVDVRREVISTARENLFAATEAAKKGRRYEYTPRPSGLPPEAYAGVMVAEASSELLEAERQARSGLDLAVAALEATQAEHHKAKEARFLAHTRVQSAVRAVVAASPEAAALIATVEATLRSLADHGAALEALIERGIVTLTRPADARTIGSTALASWQATSADWWTIAAQAPGARPWQAALLALESDPAAALPAV